MHIPKHFEENNLDVIHRIIRSRPLATLVTLCSEGINANHIPLLFSELPAPHGKLQGHVPRSNPLVSDLAENVDALAIFHGPEAYITPSWYATKRETGKVVPTWNYSVVHAYGRLEVIDDAQWLRRQVEALTRENEAKFSNPWKVSDAPSDYTDKMIRGLVGIEIVLTRLLGKTKASQNQPEINRRGVIEGLGNMDDDNAIALASLMDSEKGSAG